MGLGIFGEVIRLIIAAVIIYYVHSYLKEIRDNIRLLKEIRDLIKRNYQKPQNLNCSINDDLLNEKEEILNEKKELLNGNENEVIFDETKNEYKQNPNEVSSTILIITISGIIVFIIIMFVIIFAQ